MSKLKKEKELPINKRDFTYEILLSKGLGKLTPYAKQMLYDLGTNAINSTRTKYKSQDDMYDCLQTGLMKLYEKWTSFNPSVTINTFAYFTEIYKRGVMEGYNELFARKGLDKNDKYINHISINSTNNGQGLYNFGK